MHIFMIIDAYIHDCWSDCWYMFMMIYANHFVFVRLTRPRLTQPVSRFNSWPPPSKIDGKEGVSWKGGNRWHHDLLWLVGLFGHWHPELWKILASFWIFHDLVCVFVVFQKVHCLVNWTFGNLCLTFLRFFLFGKEHLCVGRFQPRWLCR